jgi:hypothetical protein
MRHSENTLELRQQYAKQAKVTESIEPNRIRLSPEDRWRGLETIGDDDIVDSKQQEQHVNSRDEVKGRI